MAHDLECPGSEANPDWDSLYRARGEEVMRHRPIFTGDVFEKIVVQDIGATKQKTIIVLQHPCALRSDGVRLHSRLIVAELRNHKIIPPEDWVSGHFAKMPLPELVTRATSGKRHQAAFFDELYLASSDALELDNRIACMSQSGVNLLLQRWVHHNSRVIVPTFNYHSETSPAYEEADLIEEWCEERESQSETLLDAMTEAVQWMRQRSDSGVTYQQMMKDPQTRSVVRQRMRAELRRLRG